MTVGQVLNLLGQEHKGKIIQMSNRFGYWWNYRNDTVEKIHTTNKYIYITVK